MTILIKGGTVISSTGADPAEVLVDGETIVALLSPGSDLAVSAEGGAERVLDATGRYVIPGGVDVHTHMSLPFGGTISADDFDTGTRASSLFFTPTAQTLWEAIARRNLARELRALQDWAQRPSIRWEGTCP